MHVEDRHGLGELQRLARRAKDARIRIRLQAVVLAKQGYSAPGIAELLGSSRRSVQQWVQHYNRIGVDRLADQGGRGRRCKLSHRQQERLRERIDNGSLADDRVCVLRGKDLQAILQKEFGVLYELTAVYALLHRMGYSCLMPRPQHRKADPEAQEAFKKTPLLRSNQSEPLTPNRKCRSGFRMRPASGSKVR